ncbi:MAG: MerR family transcriptional regulator, partial [Tetragenococcus halophilus]|nr:MerR family transcriptional regulator [Tetragenococcus halophilus]
SYSVGQVAKKLEISTHTLRYYDKMGLLPFVERDDSGNRVFKEKDFLMLNTVDCLKKTGMELKEIKQYIDWCNQGMETVEDRYKLFLDKRKTVLAEINELEEMLETIDYKCNFYKNAIESNTLEVCQTERAMFLEKLAKE